MQEGFVPFKGDKPKDTEISPFKAGSNWYHQARHIKYGMPNKEKRNREIE